MQQATAPTDVAGPGGAPDRIQILLTIAYGSVLRARLAAGRAEEFTKTVRTARNVLVDAALPAEKQTLNHGRESMLWEYEDIAFDAARYTAQSRRAAEEAGEAAGLCRLACEELERCGETDGGQAAGVTRAKSQAEAYAQAAWSYAEESAEIEAAMPAFDRTGAERRRRETDARKAAEAAVIAELRSAGKAAETAVIAKLRSAGAGESA